MKIYLKLLWMPVLLLWLNSPAAQIQVEKEENLKVQVVNVQPESTSVTRTSPTLERVGKIRPLLDGIVVKGRIVKIKGEVRSGVKSAWLEIDGRRQSLRLSPNGSFEEVGILTGGVNRISLLGPRGEIMDTFTLQSKAPITTLWVQFTWQADLCDLDLYVFEPEGQAVWFQNPTGRYGRLDVDDRDGYGPEHFTLSTPRSGLYRIYVQYYASHGWMGPVLFTVTVLKNEKLYGVFKGTLQDANERMAGPGSAGLGSTWRHVADVSIP